MPILFDHGTPRGLSRELAACNISLAKSMGWDRLNNGDLLKAAEEAGFRVFLTTDQRIRYQQNLSGRLIAIVVLSGTTKWTQVRKHVQRIAFAIEAATPGSYAEVFIPFR